MIGIARGISAYSGCFSPAAFVPTRKISSAAAIASRRTNSLETPVQPVSVVPPVTVEASGNVDFLRRGADPAEMAVRMRIQYAE